MGEGTKGEGNEGGGRETMGEGGRKMIGGEKEKEECSRSHLLPPTHCT